MIDRINQYQDQPLKLLKKINAIQSNGRPSPL